MAAIVRDEHAERAASASEAQTIREYRMELRRVRRQLTALDASLGELLAVATPAGD
jgi:hypothetical protein